MGYYQDQEAGTFQKLCPPATYSDQPGLEICRECPFDRAGDSVTKSQERVTLETACPYTCTVGTFVTGGWYLEFKPASNEVICNGSCEAGWFNVIGTDKCLPCGDQSFNDHPGATQCQMCDLGGASNQAEGASTCLEQRECICVEGVGMVGPACKVHGDPMCSSCNNGLYSSSARYACQGGHLRLFKVPL